MGQWKATYKTSDERMIELFGGEVTESDLSIEWSPTKRCQVVTISRDGEMLRHALWGFDPESKRWRGIGFNSDGSWGMGVHGPEILKGKFGEPFKTEWHGAKADGSPVTGVWSTTLIDQDTYELEIYEYQDNEQKLTLSLRNKRKK